MKWKKIIMTGLWVVFGVGLIVLMSFATREHSKRTCSNLNVSIARKNGDVFIREEDVQKLLSDHSMLPVDQSLSKIDVTSLEKLVQSHPAVESCEAFMDIGGEMSITIKQRRVIARFITVSNESYYVDDRGLLMPWTPEYTAPVLLVSGFFSDSYATMYGESLDRISADSAQRTSSVVDDAWQIAKRIDADTFLRAQIVQVYVSRDKGIELIPRVGNHIIVLGDISNLDEKLKKLLTFYREGLERTGRWNEYTFIDLQYKNQIVCTKKAQ